LRARGSNLVILCCHSFLIEVHTVFAENCDTERKLSLFFCLAFGARIHVWDLTVFEWDLTVFE